MAKPKSTKATSTKPAKAAGLATAWELKIRSPAYRSFVCGGHVVFWTGKHVSSIDATTGKLVATVDSQSDEPWPDDSGRVWVPTVDGFELRTPALELVKEIKIPRPKGARFWMALARVHGAIAYRLVRGKDGDFSLLAFDIEKTKQLYLAPITTSSANRVTGAVSRDRFVFGFFTDRHHDVFVGATSDGRVTRTEAREACSLILVGDHIVTEDLGGTGHPGVLRGETWQALDCTGELRRIGTTTYCIGHREIVRLDDALRPAARAPIATPPGEEQNRRPQTSICLDGDALVVVEGCTAMTNWQPPPKVPYRHLRRDPMTLAERSGAGAFEEAFGVEVLGKVGDRFVARTHQRFFTLALELGAAIAAPPAVAPAKPTTAGFPKNYQPFLASKRTRLVAALGDADLVGTMFTTADRLVVFENGTVFSWAPGEEALRTDRQLPTDLLAVRSDGALLTAGGDWESVEVHSGAAAPHTIKVGKQPNDFDDVRLIGERLVLPSMSFEQGAIYDMAGRRLAEIGDVDGAKGTPLDNDRYAMFDGKHLDIWDLATAKRVERHAIDADGQRYGMCASRDYIVCIVDYTLVVIEIASGKVVAKLKTQYPWIPVFVADGELLIVHGKDELQLYSTKTWKIVDQVPLKDCRLEGVLGGRYVIARGPNRLKKTCFVFDVPPA